MKEFIRGGKKYRGPSPAKKRGTRRKLLVGRELENGADNVSVGLLEGGDGLGTIDLALIDDDLDVVLGEAGKGLLVTSGGRGRGGRRGSILNLDKIGRVVVGSELLGSLGHVLLVVIELGLSEDDVGVRVGALVNLGARDNDVRGALEGDTEDAWDLLEAELEDGLAGLLLSLGVLGGSSGSLGRGSLSSGGSNLGLLSSLGGGVVVDDLDLGRGFGV